MSVLSLLMHNINFQHRDVPFLALGQIALLFAQLRALLTMLTCMASKQLSLHCTE